MPRVNNAVVEDSVFRETGPVAPLAGPIPEPYSPPPTPAEGSIRRSVFLTKLRAAAGNRVVVLSAPAGYGKSIVLAQWAAEDPRPFRWLTLTDEHNDPDRLRSDITALFAPERPRPRIGSPKDVTQIASRGTWPIGGPWVVVVDDAQVLTAEPARRVIDRVVRSVPTGSQVALASRGTSWGMSRWATQQQIVAIPPSDLAFSPDEQRKMIPATAGGVPAALFALCAGWPATIGVCRAVSPLSEGDPAAVTNARHRLLQDFVESEVLCDAPAADVELLTRFSILSELTGPICAALVGRAGPAVLDRAVRGGFLPMVSTTTTGGSDDRHRFHPLLKQTLLSLLRRNEPHLIPLLHQRASAWYAAAGDIDAAIRHAVQTGDMELLGVLVWAQVQPGLSNEAVRQLQDRLSGLLAKDIGRSLQLMVSVAWLALLSGDMDAVVRWQVLAEIKRNACPPTDAAVSAEIHAALALLRNWRDPGMNGLSAARSTAELFDALPAGSRWRPAAGFLAGLRLALGGDTRRAMPGLRAAEELGRVMDQPAVQADCLAALALIYFDDERADETQALAEAAERLVTGNHLQDRATSMFVCSVVGLTQARAGKHVRAEATLARVRDMIAATPHLAPWLTVQVAVLRARTFLLLGDVGQARQSIRHARRILDGDGERSVPDGGVLGLETLLDQLSVGLTYGFTPMTTSELRVLRLLPSCLSFAEMAHLLFVSRYTVKSHAMSIYRKLDASTRSQVVERACSLGYLPPSVLPKVR